MYKGIFDELNRREFMKKAAMTGAAAYLGFDCDMAAAEPPPETTRIRFQLTSVPLLGSPVSCREISPRRGFYRYPVHKT